MINKVIETIEKYNMISPGDTVTVGLSGGADSVCLLGVLINLRERFSFDVQAVHINHCIRGEEADRDENFVCKLCDDLGIKLTVFRKDIPNEAKITGESEEECGRRIRYECFSSLGTKTATAHNLTDSIETTVFNLIRGSALKGVCGIPAVRGNVIRPLIECTSSEIRDFCKENGWDFVVDSTNLKTDYTRNYIRQEILPRFEHVNSGYVKALSRFQTSAQRDNAYLEKSAQTFLQLHLSENGLYCPEISHLEDALQARVIALYVKKYSGVNLEFRHIGLISKNLENDFEMQLNNDFSVLIKNSFLSVKKTAESKRKKFSQKLLIGENQTPVCKIKVTVCDRNEINFNKKDTTGLFVCNIDYDKIDSETAVIRSRQTGDEITLAKRGVTKSLKKLYNEMKIPPEDRDKIPVIADREKVIWVFGVGYNKKCEISENTKKIMTVKVEEDYA